MLKTVLFTVLLVAQSAFAGVSGAYPKNPDPSLTPGDTCHHADAYRYPERIAYCERNVDPKTKYEVIRQYDRELGYTVGKMNRGAFKIDHYIPLCMGGSNDPSNLWPQHISVYEITDPLESLLCEKMADGRLKQADAIDMIKEAKNNLQKAREVMRRAQSL